MLPLLGPGSRLRPECCRPRVSLRRVTGFPGIAPKLRRLLQRVTGDRIRSVDNRDERMPAFHTGETED